MITTKQLRDLESMLRKELDSIADPVIRQVKEIECNLLGTLGDLSASFDEPEEDDDAPDNVIHVDFRQCHTACRE